MNVEKKTLERYLRTLFKWDVDETGRKTVIFDLRKGEIVQAQEEVSFKSADLERLKT